MSIASWDTSVLHMCNIIMYKLLSWFHFFNKKPDIFRKTPQISDADFLYTTLLAIVSYLYKIISNIVILVSARRENSTLQYNEKNFSDCVILLLRLPYRNFTSYVTFYFSDCVQERRKCFWLFENWLLRLCLVTF